MIGERNWLFWLWWRACWCFISPSLLVVRGYIIYWFKLKITKLQIIFSLDLWLLSLQSFETGNLSLVFGNIFYANIWTHGVPWLGNSTRLVYDHLLHYVDPHHCHCESCPSWGLHIVPGEETLDIFQRTNPCHRDDCGCFIQHLGSHEGESSGADDAGAEVIGLWNASRPVAPETGGFFKPMHH